MKLSHTHPLKKQPHLFYQLLHFLWEKSEPSVPTKLKFFQVKKMTFTD